MRYADCPTVSVSTRVAAAPGTVWALVSDISLPARFSSELRGAEWLDGCAGPAVGRRFVGRSAHAASGEWETTSVVTKCEPDRCFEWSVTDAAYPSSVWRFTITDVGDGTVELEQWFQMGPGPSGLTRAIVAMPDKEERIVARRLSEHQANMERTLAGIKQLAEQEAA